MPLGKHKSHGRSVAKRHMAKSGFTESSTADPSAVKALDRTSPVTQISVEGLKRLVHLWDGHCRSAVVPKTRDRLFMLGAAALRRPSTERLTLETSAQSD